MVLKTVQQTIRAHDLLQRGDHVVLGLSGGPDSVCLFHLLQRLAHPMQLTIHPVHVNHQLRPGDAERDQAYVEELCVRAAECGGAVRPCRTFVVDVNTMARELELTSEEAGRKARYEAFVQVAQEVQATQEAQAAKAGGSPNGDAKNPNPNRCSMTASTPWNEDGGPPAESGHAVSCGLAEPNFAASCGLAESADPAPRVVIAVAQNANDQAETILQRLLRGTGPDGLSGIAYERCEQEIPVIRPLLDVTRAEIEAYCEEHGLHPVRDHTNAEPIYTRNKIRLQLLPLLQEYNPNIVETLGRLARIASADRDYLQQQAAAVLEQLRIEDVRRAEAAMNVLRADEANMGAGTKCVETVVHDATGELQGHARSAAPASQFPGRVAAPISLVLDRTGLVALPEAIRHRVIVMAFEEIGLVQDITEERLRAADAIIGRKQAPKTVEFPHGYRLTVARGQVRLTSKPDTVYST